MPAKRSPKSDPVSQKEIRILLGLEQLIRQRWDLYDQEAKSVLSRILAGAEVEEGPHSAAVRRTTRRGRRVISLSLDRRTALPPMPAVLKRDDQVWSEMK